MTYFLSPALVQLRDQINAAYGHRDKASDGWIGDASHQARSSDHNPDYSDGGIVRAIDVDEDLVIGMTAVGEAQPLADALVRDPRTRYVIYEGRIAYGAHVTGVPHGWRPYTGANAHRHHIHISVRSTGNYDRDARAWALPGAETPAPPNEEEDEYMSDAAEKKLDRLLAILDGPFTDTIDGDEKEIDFGTSQDRALALGRRNETLIRRVLAAVLAKTTVEIDANSARLIADAIPDDIAEEVADTIYARLAK